MYRKFYKNHILFLPIRNGTLHPDALKKIGVFHLPFNQNNTTDIN